MFSSKKINKYNILYIIYYIKDHNFFISQQTDFLVTLKPF